MDAELMFNFQFFVKELEYRDGTNGVGCVPAVGITFLDFPSVVIFPQDSNESNDRDLGYRCDHDQRRLALYIYIIYIYNMQSLRNIHN